jgi:hypothetical protein
MFHCKKIQELHVQKVCENGQGKNPRDTGTSLANKMRFLAKLSPIVKSELKMKHLKSLLYYDSGKKVFIDLFCCVQIGPFFLQF